MRAGMLPAWSTVRLHSAQLVTDEDTDVDREDAGAALRHGHQIDQLLLAHPLLLLHHLLLYERNHGVAAADGE